MSRHVFELTCDTGDIWEDSLAETLIRTCEEAGCSDVGVTYGKLEPEHDGKVKADSHEQFLILHWIQKNFIEDTVKVEWEEHLVAAVTFLRDGSKALVSLKGDGILYDTGEEKMYFKLFRS